MLSEVQHRLEWCSRSNTTKQRYACAACQGENLHLCEGRVAFRLDGERSVQVDNRSVRPSSGTCYVQVTEHSSDDHCKVDLRSLGYATACMSHDD